MLLKELSSGQRARVIGYEKGNRNLLQRLLEMGLIRNTQVDVLRFAPMGDPMEISIRGYQLSIRLDEAALVQVELIEEKA